MPLAREAGGFDAPDVLGGMKCSDPLYVCGREGQMCEAIPEVRGFELVDNRGEPLRALGVARAGVVFEELGRVDEAGVHGAILSVAGLSTARGLIANREKTNIVKVQIKPASRHWLCNESGDNVPATIRTTQEQCK